MTEREPKLRVNLQVASPSAQRAAVIAARKAATRDVVEAPDFLYNSATDEARVPTEQIRALFSDFEGKVAAKETTSIEEDAQNERVASRRLHGPAPLDEESMLASATDSSQPIFALAAGLGGKETGSDRTPFHAVVSEVLTPAAPSGGIMYSSYAKSSKHIMETAPNKRISWRCGLCGYHVLAMDRDGNPLPLTLSAFGEPLPMRCPRCDVEHTAWTQAVPFNQFGDHVNVRSRLSNHYQAAAADVGAATPSPATATPALPPLQAAALATLGKSSAPPLASSTGATLAVEARQGGRRAGTRMAYYCGLCSRRLLRADARGELIPMDTNDKGDVLPVLCPGCAETHSNWVVKPFVSGHH